MKRSLLSVCISVGMGMTNSTQKPPTEPHDYYKITNSAGRNVIHLDGFIGYWGDEAYWLKNYLKEHEGEDIEVLISSSGGDVFAGQSIYNYLSAHKGTVTAYVERAFSIAGHIAMACDNVKIVDGGQMMIHAVSGYCGGTADDMNAYADMMENAKNAIANSYAKRTGHDVSYFTDIMKNEAGKYFTAQECVELGLADEVIEPSSMTNFAIDDVETQPDPDATDPETQDPETDENSTQDPESQSTDPVDPVVPPATNKPTNFKKDDQIVQKELDRQNSIRNLFNSLHVKLGLPITLLNKAIDDKMDIAAATTLFAEHTPEEPQEKTPLNFGGGHGNTGSDAKEMVKNVLLNRAGAGELKAEYRKYGGMDLMNAAQALGVTGFGNSLATNALDSTDFKAVIGEVTQEIVHLEAENNKALFKELCTVTKKSRLGEYGVTEYNQIDGFAPRGADGEFEQIDFDGKHRRKGDIIERGSKVTLTRAALLNDNFNVISDLPRQHVRSAYRMADNLMFQRIIEWANTHKVTAANLRALILAMRTELQERQTSKGDDLYYDGGLILSAPAVMNEIRPICQAATMNIDTVNPAFGAFHQFQTATRCTDLLIGVADGQKALELACLHGGETPELIENNSIDRANGIGWTVVWDVDVQVSNPQALVVGKIAAVKSK